MKTKSLISSGIMLLVSFSILLLSFAAFSWFASNKSVKASGMSIQAEGVLLPEVNAWRWDMDEKIDGTSEENGDSNEKDGQWVSAIDSDDKKAITPVQARTEAGEKFLFESLHLGTLDNLMFLNNDNYFYVRLDINKEKADYKKASIRYSLTGDGVHFFDVDGNEKLTDESDLEIRNGFTELLIIDCAYSTAEYEPSANRNEIEALFGDNTKLVNGADFTNIAADQNGEFYLYIRITPDLEKAFETTASIVTLMPCQLLYDVEIVLLLE